MTVTELEILEALDFRPAKPCEVGAALGAAGCSGDRGRLYGKPCPGCGHRAWGRLECCTECWADLGDNDFPCCAVIPSDCRYRGLRDDFFIFTGGA